MSVLSAEQQKPAISSTVSGERWSQDEGPAAQQTVRETALRLTIVANLLTEHELVQLNHLRVRDQVAKVLVHEATAVLWHDAGLQRPP